MTALWSAMSTEQRSEWAQEVINDTAVAQGLPFHVEDPVAISNLAHLIAASTTSASSPTLDASAGVGVGEHGAVGPRDTGTHAEADPTVGSSGTRRPTAPLTKQTRPVAAGRVQDNAG